MKTCALALIAVASCLAAPPEADKGKLLGGLGAPLSIEVYSSFACSHCKDFHERVLPQIVRDYVVSGKACVISRETFPPNLQVALEAANYATAAARIGKYQEVGDVLFREQAAWAVNGRVWETVASVLTADQQKRVQALAKDPGVVGEVQADQELARQNSVTQTPTLLVTRGAKRYPLPGLPEYSLLRSLLDSMLGAK